jgi:glycine/D-amino acid oxidase-like deaminating enzyme
LGEASGWERPERDSYDVVIVGGAMMGAACAWFLARDPGFGGRVLVVERDPTYEQCSTAHSNSCIRQQFSDPLNVRISQFTAAYIKRFRDEMDGDPLVPNLSVQNFGYLYLAAEDARAEGLRAAQAVQAAEGAGTELLTPDEIAARYPFYWLDDIVLGSLNTVDEGYWDGGTVFEWWRRKARARGVTFLRNEVTGLERQGDRITGVRLASGDRVACGYVVNAAGPRAAQVAGMAGLDLPVEPRKRYTWVFRAERPLDRPLPLTIDPSGIHVRTDGPETYMAGATPDPDPGVDPGDFGFDHALWEDRVWPVIATRIPQFEAIRVQRAWVGHYAYNVLDQNAVVGPHPEVANFLFVNGFSGHGLQQAPAMGRGVAEWIVHGGYRTLDLGPLGYARLQEGRLLTERAII